MYKFAKTANKVQLMYLFVNMVESITIATNRNLILLLNTIAFLNANEYDQYRSPKRNLI